MRGPGVKGGPSVGEAAQTTAEPPCVICSGVLQCPCEGRSAASSLRCSRISRSCGCAATPVKGNTAGAAPPYRSFARFSAAGAGESDTHGRVSSKYPHQRSHIREESAFSGGVVVAGPNAEEARKLEERLFTSSEDVARLKHLYERSHSEPTVQRPCDTDTLASEDLRRTRTASRIALLASAARSCVQKRVSAGGGTGSGSRLLSSRDPRSVHHVLFRVHSRKRRSFQKVPGENGSATEASDNGKTASSRTSSSGALTSKCTTRPAGEFRRHESDSRDATASETERKQHDMQARAAALADASVMFYGVPEGEGHDRRLQHRIDPAKLLRGSCSKCFSDDQARQTRFIEVNRPIVCEEGSSACYFRRKGEASGAPGSWPAGDCGSTVLSRRLACMLEREVQRELRYGFYPICTRAAMLWVSLVGSLIFLSIGTWLTVEDERHVECKLHYEGETLPEGGSRYSLLSITADLCSGRLHTVDLNTDRAHGSSQRAPRRGIPLEEDEESSEPGGFGDARRHHQRQTVNGHDGSTPQFESSLQSEPLTGGIRKKVPRRRGMGYSAASSAPLGYMYRVPPPAPEAQRQRKRATSVVSELSGPYIYVYVEMSRFYQDDAQVLWSRKDEQLAGRVFTDPRDLKECEPAVTAVIDNVIKVLHPCGVMAWNVFTDRFQFLDAVPDDSTDVGSVGNVVLEQNADVLLNSFGDWRRRFKNPPADVRAKYRDRVYFWMSVKDNDDGKDMYKTREEAKAELLMDRLNYDEAGEMVENGHFIQWMHTAPFGKWRKFYGRLRGPVKLPLFAYIAVTYDVKLWRGKKAIVLVQPSRFGGRTQSLGTIYLVFGCFLAIVASYMVWRKWYYVAEDEAVHCSQDLRWRTRRRRRGKTK